MLKRGLLWISKKSKKLARRLDRKNQSWFALLAEWKRRDVEEQFRTRYPELETSSVVFDLGGFRGQWASDIYGRYGCRLLVFEPIPDYARRIRDRFARNDKIEVYDFGLGARDESLPFALAGDSTSSLLSSGNQVTGKIRNIQDFLAEADIEKIDLMKINIEGGEYELLEYLIENGMAGRIKNLQIQFHHFVPNAKERMGAIQRGLAETHELTYQFEFLWENWRIKS